LRGGWRPLSLPHSPYRVGRTYIRSKQRMRLGGRVGKDNKRGGRGRALEIQSGDIRKGRFHT